MKNILLVAVATSLALSPAGIQAQNVDIVVSSNRAIDRFVQDVSRDLERELNRPTRAALFYSQGSGVSQVLFECGPDGKPTNISMYSKAGDASVDRRARRAVAKIHSLHPLPQGVDQNQLYLANVIIAEDAREYDQLSAELNQRETQRIAAAKGDRKIFAFTLGKSPST